MSNMISISSSAERNEGDDPNETVELLDMSSWQRGLVHWDHLDPIIQVVVPRLTNGVHEEDRAAKEHCAGARDTGRLLGGYHFLRIRHGKPQDAKQQAHDFAEVYTREKCAFAVIDSERADNEDATAEEAKEATTLYVAELKAILNPSQVLYSSGGEIKTFHLGECTELADLPLWQASYGSARPTPPPPWSNVFVWQYTGTGRVAGIDGNIDRSRFYGSLRSFRNVLGI